MCLENLKRRKGRTILTVLGVFIGCTSIIVMVSIGIGLSDSQTQWLSEMGDLTVIEVSTGYSESSGTEAKLDDAAVKNFKEISGVEAVMPKASFEYSANLKAGVNDRYTCDWVSLVGLDVDAMEQMGYVVQEGKVPGVSEGEVLGGQYLAYSFTDSLMPEGRNMIDRWSAYDEEGNPTELPDPYFDVLNTPLTMEVSIDENNTYKTTLKVVGVTKEDYGKGWETSEGIMMSIDSLKELISKIKGTPVSKLTYSQILVKVSDISLVPDVESSIKAMGYSTYSMESIRESMEKSSRQIQLVLGGLGAISLFVAAIGITNTMIMSISERTREIGIMKSLGCYVRDIRLLFLMEAGTIGLMGGILGCIISLVISVIINLFSMGAIGEGVTGEMIKMAIFGGEGVTRTSIIPVTLMLFAIAFSILVGLVSGYYPANKAVKISALEAIRRE
jgi:ABC-type antimicrobial peptide transport system permease subunit